VLIAHLSDIHIAESVGFDGTVRVLSAFADEVERRDVNLVLIAGDLGHPRRAPARATPAERNAIAAFVVRVAAVCPVVMVRGNHDEVGDWTFLKLLETEHPIAYYERPGSCVRFGAGQQAMIHAIPWLSPRWFADQVAELGLDVADGHAWIEEAIGPAFDRIRADVVAAPGMVHLGIGHLSVRGGQLGNGQALVGHEVQVSADLLGSLGLSYFALGHLHEPQEVAPHVWYSGSPNRLDFGEAGKRCGFLLAHVGVGEDTRVEFVDLPADVLACVDLDVTEADGVVGVGDALFPQAPGAKVRLRFRIPEGLHAEDAIADAIAQVSASGATAVVERIVVAANRSRAGADEVAQAPSIAEKVQAYLDQRKTPKRQTRRVLTRLTAVAGATS
jgi:DNA repair exonuclease SbcCD nuclease subunit